MAKGTRERRHDASERTVGKESWRARGREKASRRRSPGGSKKNSQEDGNSLAREVETEDFINVRGRKDLRLEDERHTQAKWIDAYAMYSIRLSFRITNSLPLISKRFCWLVSQDEKTKLQLSRTFLFVCCRNCVGNKLEGYILNFQRW